MNELNASQIAALLEEIGRRLELEGAETFKARAYHRAAESLRALREPLERLVEEGRLREIPAVGEAITEKIESFYRTGTHRTLEKLREGYPAGILELFDIPGLPTPKIALLHEKLGIASLAHLEAACEVGHVAACKRLGARLQAKILDGIRMARENEGLFLLDEAFERADGLVARISSQHPNLQGVIAAGDVRRSCEIVRGIRLVAADPDSGGSIKVDGARMRTAHPSDYGIALLWETGSDEHLRALQEHAKSHGYLLSEQGLSQDGRAIPCPREEGVYEILGLPWIPPELREGREELQWAPTGQLPILVEESDIKGILHAHTDASDGVNTLEEMAEGCRARGWQYFGVADHSQTAAYAGGLREDRVRDQQRQVDALNAVWTDFRVFKGIESDIRVDGSLDYSDSVLQSFDFVVASVHGRFALDEPEQTARILKAIRNPRTIILGHLTGRLLLRRPSYPLDIERVLQACAEHGVAVEINADPRRLELDWRWHQMALEVGCLFSIDPDAHSVRGMEAVKWGVRIARKGAIPADRILSCWPVDRLADHFDSRNQTAGSQVTQLLVCRSGSL